MCRDLQGSPRGLGILTVALGLVLFGVVARDERAVATGVVVGVLTLAMFLVPALFESRRRGNDEGLDNPPVSFEQASREAAAAWEREQETYRRLDDQRKRHE
jgi:hypothetical protein